MFQQFHLVFLAALLQMLVSAKMVSYPVGDLETIMQEGTCTGAQKISVEVASNTLERMGDKQFSASVGDKLVVSAIPHLPFYDNPYSVYEQVNLLVSIDGADPINVDAVVRASRNYKSVSLTPDGKISFELKGHTKPINFEYTVPKTAKYIFTVVYTSACSTTICEVKVRGGSTSLSCEDKIKGDC